MDAEAVIEEFEFLTKNASKVQKETLKKILEENGETEYLQKWGLKGRSDPDSFKACVPLASHTHFEPYIQAIADATKPSILTRKPITRLTLSSGTTEGKPKFVPFNDESMEIIWQVLTTSVAFRNREYPIDNGKVLQFIYISKPLQTKGGVAVGTATSHILGNTEWKKVQTPYCSPDEVVFGPDYDQSLYCHLLCGLIFRDQVQIVYSVFAHTLVDAFRAFELVWEELVEDIRQGSLSSRVTVPSIRASMSKLLLNLNPALANDIRGKIVGLRSWYGVIQELFPNAKYVYGVMTGSMEAYVIKLRHYAGELPLVSANYLASEGWVGVNVNPKLPPESATFAVVPNSCYFEFIPLKDGQELQPPLGLTEVNVGEEYEIIITTCAGLYRYRLGDVVKVQGFYNSTPEIQFVRRRDLLLSINIDKNTEKDLQLAVEEAAKLLATEKIEVVDFTSRVDSSTEPGHYIIFWETSGEAPDEVLQECCNCLDRAFVDAGYTSSRKINAIGPLELRIVKAGTFRKMWDHYVGLGAAVGQLKTPRCVGPTNNTVLQILSVNSVKNYISTAY